MNCGSMFPTFVRNNFTATPPAETFVHQVAKASLPQPARVDVPISITRLVDLLDENGEDDYGLVGPI